MVYVLPDADQQQIIDGIAEFVAKELPVSRFRPGQHAPREAERWDQLSELGYLTLALPETSGGGGFSFAEEVLTFRELGRGLVSPAVIATTMAAHALALGGLQETVEAIVAGTTRAAPGIRRGDGSLMLLDADGAEFILTCGESEISLYRRAEFNDLAVHGSLDDSVSLTITHAPPPAFLVVPEDQAPLARRMRLLVTAMLVGIAEQARDMAVSYAKDRVQFGKPIGSFQAIKHRCADMAMRSEMALSQLFFATIVERDALPGATFHTGAAALLAIRAATANSADSIQIHGGIAFTAEYDAHLFLKRSRVLENLCGTALLRQQSLLQAVLPA